MKKENNFNFNWRYLDYEIRTTFSLADKEEKLPYVELIKWKGDDDKNHCFTLAYFKWNKEGGEFIMVGDRPFKYVESSDVNIIWRAMGMATTLLTSYYDIVRDE